MKDLNEEISKEKESLVILLLKILSFILIFSMITLEIIDYASKYLIKNDLSSLIGLSLL